MTVSIKAEKMLWGRAANRCAVCRRELVIDATETDDETLAGDACHIVAESINGPRGNSDLTPQQRDKYGNLVLLCKVHHKIIDDQLNTYTVEKLHEIKSSHEKWVREALTDYDSSRQRDDEIYAGYVDEWSRLIDIENWKTWSSWMMTPQPLMRRDCLEQLDELRSWILSRIWPKRYEELEASFQNFRFVLDDFIRVFREYAEPTSEDRELMTRKFYHLDEWNPLKYQHRLRQFHFHIDLVHDLMLELTRSANYICDKVRQYILPSYRLREGVILIMSGPYMNLDYVTHRPEYKREERILYPYPGLSEFMKIRETRSDYFGKGELPDSPHYFGLVPDTNESDL